MSDQLRQFFKNNSQNYSNSLCLTPKIFPWANEFGLEMSPKQFYTRAVEFVSKKYLYWLFRIWMKSRRIQLVAVKCDSVYFN